MEKQGTSSGNFDSTIGILQEGATQVAIDRAARDIEGWQHRLQAADDRELTHDTLDGITIGGLLRTLADQVRHVAPEGTEASNAAQVVGKPEDLGRLLDTEGRSLSGA